MQLQCVHAVGVLRRFHSDNSDAVFPNEYAFAFEHGICTNQRIVHHHRLAFARLHNAQAHIALGMIVWRKYASKYEYMAIHSDQQNIIHSALGMLSVFIDSASQCGVMHALQSIVQHTMRPCVCHFIQDIFSTSIFLSFLRAHSFRAYICVV